MGRGFVSLSTEKVRALVCDLELTGQKSERERKRFPSRGCEQTNTENDSTETPGCLVDS